MNAPNSAQETVFGSASGEFQLTAAQIHYFNTFGYLRLPGLFKPDIARLTEGFEDVFREHGQEAMDYRVALHNNERRVNMMGIVERSEKMRWLLDDARVHAILAPLFRTPYGYTGSDGNLFYCESSWHYDSFGAPLDIRHIKLSFYLDPLTAETGAIRVIPGTHHYHDVFSQMTREALYTPEEIVANVGVEPSAIPSVPLATEPGDLVCWDFRTQHASFRGDARRRLFSLSFREEPAAATSQS